MQPVPGAPARAEEQTVLLHPFLLPDFVLEVSAVGFWSLNRSATWLLGGATGGCTGRGHAPFCSTRPMLYSEMKGNCPPELSQCESLTCVGPSVSAQERAIQHPGSSQLIPVLPRGTKGLWWLVPFQRDTKRGSVSADGV